MSISFIDTKSSANKISSIQDLNAKEGNMSFDDEDMIGKKDKNNIIDSS